MTSKGMSGLLFRLVLITALLPALALAEDPTEESEDKVYFRQVMTAVHQRFTSPQVDEQQRGRLRAQAVVRIGPQGELLEVTLGKASGQQAFDAAALDAVKKASPFPAPPAQLRDVLKKKGVAIVFVP